jgi:hypothetical protein
LLSSHGPSGDEVERLVCSSPDHTLYHRRPYTDFWRAQGLRAEVVVAVDGDELVFALPVYPESARWFESGFCGFVFPREAKKLPNAVDAIRELFACNAHLRHYAGIQSVLGEAGRDASRRVLIDSLLSSLGPEIGAVDLFTRVIELAPPSNVLERRNTVARIATADLDRELLATYDGDIRNQIRQADRHGLTIDYALIATPDRELVERTYATYGQLHGQSWERTGLTAHTSEYWRMLSPAVAEGGGVDVVVIVRAGEAPIAGVTCHIYQQQAIYWSGGSTPEGLAKRANPLALHAGISLCRRLGAEWFEVGRFAAHESDKLRAIAHYKSQFGGSVVRVPNLRCERENLSVVVADEAWRFRYRMPSDYPAAWRYMQRLAPIWRRVTAR